MALSESSSDITRLTMELSMHMCQLENLQSPAENSRLQHGSLTGPWHSGATVELLRITVSKWEDIICCP